MTANRVGCHRVLTRGAVVAMATAVALGALPPCAAQAHPHRLGRSGNGVVRCVAASTRSSSRLDHAGGLPTNRAVFFARSGSRCLWHHRALDRG